ncbi:hypothetical protein DFQ04_0569 [Algoriphagus boseongensis]|uniref:Uncharacterized protein n=1 Tax=Algoriphagus boseongensis TaxID=1442587 RepID=A0A4R6T7V0_9BACT|nr:hypothetical protein [Algoriphagus boseongensis]TDQ18761.1 hypothetical protein DFQ04_0569 [Algoriphagus boseongensis]
MTFFSRFLLGLCFFLAATISFGQGLVNKRPTFYVITGISGANLTQFNQLLDDRGLSRLQNRYRTYGLGYQTRINDFILGFELTQHQSKANKMDEMEIKYRTSRAMFNVGYSMTEEGRFQLIHYMALGFGYMNFQMLPMDQSRNLELFLLNPKEGFILRKNDIQMGTQRFGDFLTEIGFQLSYDFDLPGRKEAIQVLAKGGYSFSPFEGSWEMNGLAFDNAQSGAFIRLGAGISLPEKNFFYKDASISINFIRGIHFTEPNKLNEILENYGYQPLEGTPSNWGLRILGDTEGLLYGVDVFNLAMKGQANNFQNHTLNSLRVYANGGLKFLQYKNFAIGAIGGLGYGNLRYTLSQNSKPNFPELFEQRYFDGYLKSSALMLKPEVLFEYGLPMTKRKLFDLVFTASAGYELGFPDYRLGEIGMTSYMNGGFLTFGVGLRP